MSEASRKRILERLRRAVSGTGRLPAAPPAPKRWSRVDKIARLKRLMEAVRAEVHITTAGAWAAALIDIVRRKDIQTLLFAPRTDTGKALAAAWQSAPGPLPTLVPYERKIEAFKQELFTIDAAVTAAAGAIAETGALIVWPSPAEPRLMSLVPPIHIAVVSASTIYDTFADAIGGENWAGRMPTNALLISGPSKTADIEMTLAFGVHGPRELVVIIVDD